MAQESEITFRLLFIMKVYFLLEEGQSNYGVAMPVTKLPP